MKKLQNVIALILLCISSTTMAMFPPLAERILSSDKRELLGCIEHARKRDLLPIHNEGLMALLSHKIGSLEMFAKLSGIDQIKELNGLERISPLDVLVLAYQVSKENKIEQNGLDAQGCMQVISAITSRAWILDIPARDLVTFTQLKPVQVENSNQTEKKPVVQECNHAELLCELSHFIIGKKVLNFN